MKMIKYDTRVQKLINTEMQCKLQHLVIVQEVYEYARLGHTFDRTVANLAEQSNVCPRTLQRALRQLQKRGLIVLVEDNNFKARVYDLSPQAKKFLKIK